MNSAAGALTTGAQPFDEHRTAGDLDSFFVEGRVLKRHLLLRLGRQLAVGGAVRATQVDGLAADGVIAYGFGAQAWVGVPVQPRFSQASGDFLTGARLFWRQAFDSEQSTRLAERVRKAEFSLDDFLEQLRQLKKMGSLEEVLQMLPGIPKGALAQAAPDTGRMRRYEAILLSMTPRERRHPRVIDGSRRRRIAAGSGTSVPEVNQLLRDFEQARTLMKRMRHGRRGLPGLRGRMR